MKKTVAVALCLASLFLLNTVVVSFSNTAAAVASSTPAPLFTINTLVPNTPTTRLAWVTIIENEWHSIGIGTNLAVLPFNDVVARDRPTNSSLFGATWNQGGYDLTYNRYGIGGTFPPNPAPYWGCSATPPQGFFYWCDQTAQNLLNTYEQDLTENNQTGATQALDQYQTYAWSQASPNIPIFNNNIVDLVSPNVEGYNCPFYVYLCFADPQNLTIENATSPVTYVLADDNIPTSFSPLFDSGSWHNWYGPVFDTLETITNWQTKTPEPDLAVNWTQSTDGKTVVINLRQGVTWQDGWPFNATDVAFTWDTIMNPAAGTSDYYGVRPILQDANWTITGPYQITLKFAQADPFWQYLLYGGQDIVPYHILHNVPLDQLSKIPFSTGVGTYTVPEPNGSVYTAHGPIGTGPYTFTSWDPVGQVVTLTRNPNYWGNITGNVQIYKDEVFNTADAAIAALKAGQVTDVYNLFTPETYAAQAVAGGWGKVANFSNILTWEIELNHNDPIFGTGLGTPLGEKNASLAPQAALDVRMALSYATPDQAIVNQFGLGYGAVQNGPVPLGFPQSISNQLPSRNFNLTKAVEYLRMAGYNESLPGQTTSSPFPLVDLIVVVVVVLGGAATTVYLVKVRGKGSSTRAPPVQRVTIPITSSFSGIPLWPSHFDARTEDLDENSEM